MSNDMTTWHQRLGDEMTKRHDPGPVIAYAPSIEDFQVRFDAGYGGSEGPHVLAWTDTRVYFPVVYDGAEWMGSAPRNPTTQGQRHVGGE